MSAPGRARAPEFSISLQNRGVLARPDTIVPIAERAEALSYDALWTADHVVMPMRRASKYPYSVTGDRYAGATPVRWRCARAW